MKDSWLKRILVNAYEFYYERRRMLILRTKYRLHIMSPDRTIKYIEKRHCSIARFGDGEFDLAMGVREQGFQAKSFELAKELKNTLANKNSNVLVCIPRCMNTVRGCNHHSREFWIEWGRKNNHHQEIVNMIKTYSGNKYLFGDSQITRPYIDWSDNKRAKRIFPKLRKLWQNKEIMIIEGEKTRLGVGNDLFDNAKSIKRILAPAINAFDYRKEIEKIALDNYHGELILIALGPTATILATSFAEEGIQALDIGNIDIEYEWYIRGVNERIAIPGKFTNEAPNGRNVSECSDERYLGQIIAHIGC